MEFLIRWGFFLAPVVVVRVEIYITSLILAQAFFLTVVGFLAKAFTDVISFEVGSEPFVNLLSLLFPFSGTFP